MERENVPAEAHFVSLELTDPDAIVQRLESWDGSRSLLKVLESRLASCRDLPLRLLDGS